MAEMHSKLYIEVHKRTFNPIRSGLFLPFKGPGGTPYDLKNQLTYRTETLHSFSTTEEYVKKFSEIWHITSQ